MTHPGPYEAIRKINGVAVELLRYIPVEKINARIRAYDRYLYKPRLEGDKP